MSPPSFTVFRPGATAFGRTLALTALLLLLSGCETLGYYTQAVSGHLQLLSERQATETLRAAPDTPTELVARLNLTDELLAFAVSELKLPGDDQYRHYVELDRDAVVYNVMAAPKYDLEPVQWCFPIAGCVAYRGYFQRDQAQRKAAALAARGFDVHVGGAAAYSTLGWFSDPLLSSFVHWDDIDLAELLFHELAHVRTYLPGDTTFNESYATFVGREGVRRWLAERGNDFDRQRFDADRARRRYFVEFVLHWRQLMADRYDSLRQAGAEEKAFDAARASLWTMMRQTWLEQRPDAADHFDGFFLSEPSNARLNTVADYHGLLPVFAVLFESVDEDFGRFHERVAALAEMTPEERGKVLDAAGKAGARQPGG